jgi:hypothetical protein
MDKKYEKSLLIYLSSHDTSGNTESIYNSWISKSSYNIDMKAMLDAIRMIKMYKTAKTTEDIKKKCCQIVCQM